MKYVSIYLSALALGACSLFLPRGGQQVDDDWQPQVVAPAYGPNAGPRVLVDAAHGNFHTIDGRYRAFAELLRADGYQVDAAHEPVSAEWLAQADVLVISNAVLGGEEASWTLPTPLAFEADEVVALERWVHSGGSLLLIADHMPFPGSVENLAATFGLVFLNGYAKPSVEGRGIVIYQRETGSLADHIITHGRNSGEAIPSVKAFTGQAFRALRPIEPLLLLPADWWVYFPTEASTFDDNTPRESAAGLVQGAVFRHGSGRVAVFGEAAMFSSQAYSRGEEIFKMGMSDPEAEHNAQFVLNVMHWLSGILTD